MGFLPPIKTKGLITMKLIHAEYNPMHNSIDINHYNGYILRIDCEQAESGIRPLQIPNGAWMLWRLIIRWNMQDLRWTVRCRHGWTRKIVWSHFNTYAMPHSKGMAYSNSPNKDIAFFFIVFNHCSCYWYLYLHYKSSVYL